MKKTYMLRSLYIILSFCLYSPFILHAAEQAGLSNGQTIYLPVYSHIHSGNRERPFALTVTLGIRNIDPTNQMTINNADYYETQGKLLKNYLAKPATLNPLESIRYVVGEKDKDGGSGTNFMVEWKPAKFMNPPIVESIMIGT
jgi:hypothetical protein